MPFIDGIFNQHWLLIAFFAPAFWALVSIIDVYFVGGVYKDELDGTIIFSIVQIIPALIILFFIDVDFGQFVGVQTAHSTFLVDNALWLAFFGGVFFTLSFYFYFKALFSGNDAAMLQILWGLTAVAVAVLSYFFVGENLESTKYLGIAITLAGAVMISFNKTMQEKISWRYLKTMLGAIVFVAVSMIIAGQAYTTLDTRESLIGQQSFFLGFLCFTLGALLVGLILALIFRRNPIDFIKKYWKFFLFLEAINFFGNLASQRAISIAPSVSFVAAIESFVPVFILLYSTVILLFSHFFRRVKQRGDDIVGKIYEEQLDGKWIKVVATLIMSFGIYLIS